MIPAFPAIPEFQEFPELSRFPGPLWSGGPAVATATAARGGAPPLAARRPMETAEGGHAGGRGGAER